MKYLIGMQQEVVSSKCVSAVLQKTHHRAPLLFFLGLGVKFEFFLIDLLASESHVIFFRPLEQNV